MQLTINVPDDSALAQEIQSWQDGGNYNLGVRQTGIGAFDLLEAGASEAEEDEVEQNNEGDVPAPDGKNPAMVVMVGKMRSGTKEK